MAHDREVAGLRCGEVLERLSSYVDGELAEAERAQVDAHLRGCDWCERFGGRFAETLAAVRRELAAPPEVDDALTGRLLARLDAEEG